MITTSPTALSWITLNPMKTTKRIAKYLLVILMFWSMSFLIIKGKSPLEFNYYKHRLQPSIGMYYEVISISGYKAPSTFMIVNELRFEKVYDDLVVIPRRICEIELPKNQIGKAGKYLILVTVDKVLTVKNFADLSELRDYKKL